MDVVSIVVSVVISLLMIAVSFYLYTVYCHPQDKGIGISIGSKIIVIFCQFLSWGQLMIIPLDISNSLGSDSTSMEILYSVVYIVIFAFTSFIIPFTMFLYQSDQEDSLIKRVLWSLLFSGIVCAIWSVLIFVSYIWLSKYTYNGVQGQLSVPLYMMVCMSFVGWIFLAINGGIGLVFLPFELIKQFFVRPKQITSQQAFQQKKSIQTRSQQLIELGQSLKKKQVQLKQGNFNWFVKKKKQSELKGQVQRYKQQVCKLQTTFTLFDQQIGGIKPIKDKKDKDKAKDADKQVDNKIKNTQRSPIYYCMCLTFGIIAGLVSIVWIIQLIGTTIRSNKVPVFTFLDNPLVNLQNTPGIGFLSVAIYAILVLYLQGCSVKGSIVFGIRIPFIISFHPMIKDRTYLNSFLFNVNLMMLTSIGTTQLTVLALPRYLGESYLGQIINTQVANLPFFGFIYNYRIFMAAMDIIFFISIGVMIFQIVREALKNKKKKQ